MLPSGWPGLAGSRSGVGAAWTHWFSRASPSLSPPRRGVPAPCWRGVPLDVRLKILLSGVSALALWIPVPFIAVASFVFGVSALPLFPLFIAPIPLVIWGAICATLYLSRHAAVSLLGPRRANL